MDSDQKRKSQSMTEYRLADVLGWAASHPDIDDMDAASERVLGALDSLSGQASSTLVKPQTIEPIVNLLNQLLDTIGNCETEERNLKMALWSEIVQRAAAARSILQADR